MFHKCLSVLESRLRWKSSSITQNSAPTLSQYAVDDHSFANTKADFKTLQDALESVTCFYSSCAAGEQPISDASSLSSLLSAAPVPLQALVVSLRAAALRNASIAHKSDPTRSYVAKLEEDNQRLADLVSTSTTAHLQQQLAHEQKRSCGLEERIRKLEHALRSSEQDASSSHTRVEALEADLRRLRSHQEENSTPSSSRRYRERSRSRDRVSDRERDRYHHRRESGSYKQSESQYRNHRQEHSYGSSSAATMPAPPPPRVAEDRSSSSRSPPRPGRSGRTTAANRLGVGAAIAEAQASQGPGSSRQRLSYASPPRDNRKSLIHALESNGSDLCMLQMMSQRALGELEL